MVKKDKNYKRINRYELFQITFCYLLTLVAGIYNMFYTWYGRQIFWIDIEDIAMCVLMIIFKLVIIFKSEKFYSNLEAKNISSKAARVYAAGVDDDEDDQDTPQGDNA